MRPRAFVALAAAGCLGLGACAQAPSPSSQPSVAVDRLVAAGRDATTPGVAVAVIRDGKIVKEAAAGMTKLGGGGEPVGPETAFRLASVSKQFTAMAVMMLEQEGRLSYDDPVTRFLPELSRFGDALTIRHLLTHTGGLPDYYDVMVKVSGVERPRNRNALDVYAVWGEPLFAPGERYEYSNPGYELLALIVERASGQRFSDFVEQRIFAPLGMRSSHVYDEREPEIAHRAYGYRRAGDGFELYDDDPLNYLVGSGGVYSTVEDMARWDQALYGDALVSQETLAEAFRPVRLAGGETYPYGFGWRLGSHLGRRRVAHAGGWVGFDTFIARYPDDHFSVIVLSNLEGTGSEALADAVAGLYLGGEERSTVIANARLADGSGAPLRQASVRIVGDRIAEVGAVEPTASDVVVDATGLVLAPGFIDTHSHADDEIWEQGDALADLSQGITTVVVGQDGASPYPLRDFFARLEREPAAINVASYAGFGTLRSQVMGEDFRRPARPDEIERMRALLREEMDAGALGLATGLEYEPDLYSTPGEVLALAREAASQGGRYISHIRSEDRHFWEALDELLNIGRETGMPVQVSHIKLALRSDRGQAERLVQTLDAARQAGVEVSADIYPYTYWESTLEVLFPDRVFDHEAAAYALSEITTPDGAYLGEYLPEPAYAGKSLAQVAALRGVDPPTALIELVHEARAYREKTGEQEVEQLIATSMDEADVERLMRWPHTNLCSDGSLDGPHPRGFGSFPRFLGRYVRERGVVDLATAVHKMSGLAADHMGIRDRGRVQPGMLADLVLFDPAEVLDRATPEDPHAVSTGIGAVWVNGVRVYHDGKVDARRPGRVIRRQPQPSQHSTQPPPPSEAAAGAGKAGS